MTPFTRRRWLLLATVFAGGLTSPRHAFSQMAAPTARGARTSNEVCQNTETMISPYDFGAIGDGLSDDTAPCNAAANQAQTLGGSLVFPPGVFAISQYIIVRAGVCQVLGRGGTIRCINTAQDAGILLTTDHGGRKMRGCRIEGLAIDCNQVSTAATNAIYGQGIDACELVGNRIAGLTRGYGILVRSMSNVGAGCQGNRIIDNVIEAETSERPDCIGIAVDALLAFSSGHHDAPAEWRAKQRAATPFAQSRDNAVIGNSVMGGYYGLSLSATHDSEVRRNRFAHNVRNISLQNGCTANAIADNECLQSLSSGIHLAYGASRNSITRNRIRSDRAFGEGLLQAYVGTTDNVFESNITEALAPASPKYHCYVAVHADRNKFLANRLSGACSRAYIAIESGFNPSSKDPTHRNFKLAASTGHFATDGMSGVVIEGNQIEARSRVPILYLSQIADDQGSYPLIACELVDNVAVAGTADLFLKLVEDTPGQLSQMVFERNSFPLDEPPGKLVLPRGTAHFTRFGDNTGFLL